MCKAEKLTFSTSIASIMPYALIVVGALLLLYALNFIVLSTLKLLLGIFAVLLIIGPLMYRNSYRVQRSSVFLNYAILPTGQNNFNPSKYGMKGVLNFYLTSDDNIKLGVWHVLPEYLVEDSIDKDEDYYKNALKDGRDVIVYNHGNARNRSASHRRELYEVLRRDFHVIAFDYRGYGDSTNKEPSEIGVVRDSMYVYKWVRSLSTSNVYVWGHSLGTAVSTHTLSLLTDNFPNGLILESPFNNMRDEIAAHPSTMLFRSLPWFTYTVVEPIHKNFAFKSDEYINNVNCPIMILHAKDDFIVPYKLGLKLYEDAQRNRMEKQGRMQFHSFERRRRLGHRYICRAPELSALIKNFAIFCNEEQIRISAL